MADEGSEKAYLLPSILIRAGAASAMPLMNSRMYVRFGDQTVSVEVPLPVAVLSDRTRLMAGDIHEFLNSVRVASRSPARKRTARLRSDKTRTHVELVRASIPFHSKAQRLIVYFIVITPTV
jgi:hypothetical protein